MDHDKLVILADARDVALNVPDNEAFASLAVDNFIETFNRLTKDKPNAIVLSAEAQCCVSAMTHAHPSEYFDTVSHKRNKRACASGSKDCRWWPNQNIEDWQVFMEDLAFNLTGEELSDVYLNAGLMAGYPSDLIKMLDLLDIAPYEDDQAVLSGYLYSYPELVVLDYRQEMFGNNQWPRGLVEGCVFESQAPHLPLVHTEAGTEPLIIHTPGKFYGCLDILIEELGGESQMRYLMKGEFIQSIMSDNGFGILDDMDLDLAGRMPPPIKPVLADEGEAENYGSNYGSNYGYGNYGNYGNYGYGNYGNYGNYGTNYGYGNYGQYSGQRRRTTVRSFLGNMVEMLQEYKESVLGSIGNDQSIIGRDGVEEEKEEEEEEEIADSTNYGYGNYGSGSQYGQYSNYADSNYGYGNYGNGNYGNGNYGNGNYGYGNYGYGNYGYGNYGYGNYGYGNYGYGNYGNYGRRR
jgi:hypothetical protein